MVKVWFRNCIYGNRYETVTGNFDSIDSLIEYLLRDDWRGIFYDYQKNGKEIYCRRDYLGTFKKERETTGEDFELDISTNDHYGVYKRIIKRIDVNDLCILNREKNGEETKIVVTNTAVREFFEPLFKKFEEKAEVKYAD